MGFVKQMLCLVSSVLLSACGVRQTIDLSPPSHLGAPPGGGGLVPQFLTGALSLVGAQPISLEALGAKPLALIFASDTCDVCLEEATNIRDAFDDPAVEPAGVRFVTAMVGIAEEDARAWKHDNRIPWSVGWDEKLELFKTWCGGTTVPCTLIQIPEKGVIFRHTGEVSADQIKTWTGPWEKT